MPDVMDLFPELPKWDTQKLYLRQNELKADLTRPRTDDELRELVVISRILRTRTGGSKTPRAGSAKTPVSATLDDL